MKHLFLFLTAFLITSFTSNYVQARQSFPPEMHLSPDGHRLVLGNQETEGFYDERLIRRVDFTFPTTNYWTLLTNNNQAETNLMGSVGIDGQVMDSVGIRFRGQTSYSQNNSQKKSFTVELDWLRPDQDFMGYNSLKFNCGFLDHSFIRENLYLSMSRKHLPSAKANHIHLYINGTDWGLYANVQPLDGRYLTEWFQSNNGTRWRALRTSGGGGGGGGGGFGAGTSSLNYLGSDTSLFKPNYTLKKANKTNPWDDLVITTRILNQVPLAQLEDSLRNYLDVDRALWFIAHEILFTDDDSYVFKGGMDYYVYWDPETGRITPLEYDGNTCIDVNFADSWSVFYKETDIKYPLMNRLLKVPALRQRYLAHVRTILEESFEATFIDARIDEMYDRIDSLYAADPKKIYTLTQFNNARAELKEFFEVRKTFINSNSEVNQESPSLSNVAYFSQGQAFAQPAANEQVTVNATASHTAGILNMTLYYATGIWGQFQKMEMFDDGIHADGAASDGVFGANLPAFAGGIAVRFYVRATANNTAQTVSFEPKGAEHDVYYFKVADNTTAAAGVVINEVMASNTMTMPDQDGEFDDWIELFNTTNTAQDLGNHYLTDNLDNLTKYQIPAGTVIPAGGYLIIWADENGMEQGFHANFKLSAAGEEVHLVTPDSATVLQSVVFGQQQSDKGYARQPNGTGNFVIKNPTFSTNNDLVSAENILEEAVLSVSPNPTDGLLDVKIGSDKKVKVQLFNTLGHLISETTMQGAGVLDLSLQPSGVYFLKVGNLAKRVVRR